jgi:hypothetical protein
MEQPDDPDAAHGDDHGPHDDASTGEVLEAGDESAGAGSAGDGDSGEREVETVG